MTKIDIFPLANRTNIISKKLEEKPTHQVNLDTGDTMTLYTSENSRLGEGDMSTVYKATLSNGIPVAAKVLIPNQTLTQNINKERQVKIFQHEAQNLKIAQEAGIRGVPKYYGYGEVNVTDNTKLPVIAREHFEKSLAGVKLSESEVLAVIGQVADTLTDLAEHDIKLFDIPRENIFMRSEHQYVIGDLNLAVSNGKMLAGMYSVTLPPELQRVSQVEQQTELSNIDTATAQTWSLAMLAYDLLGGKVLPEVSALGLSMEAIPSLPAETNKVLAETLTSSQESRKYKTPKEFAEALAKVLGR